MSAIVRGGIAGARESRDHRQTTIVRGGIAGARRSRSNI
jgi:hypothetical protein